MQYHVSLAPVKYRVVNQFLFLKGNTSNSGGDDGSVKIKWPILYCIKWHFKFGWISTERGLFPSCIQSLIDGDTIRQRKTIILEDYPITIWKWRSRGRGLVNSIKIKRGFVEKSSVNTCGCQCLYCGFLICPCLSSWKPETIALVNFWSCVLKIKRTFWPN